MRLSSYLLRITSAATVAISFAMPKLRERLRLSPPAALAAVAAGVPAAAIAVPPRRWRPYGIFMTQMWAYLRGFELAYAEPERLRRRLRIDEPIKVDRLLCRGRTPTERLQAMRARWRRRHLVDRAAGVVYFAWALERHAVLVWILWRHPVRFARAAALVAATFDACWLLFSAFPVAPPWWAGKSGRLDARRITVDVSESLPLVPTQNEEDDDQGNPWASTPSQHAASAAMVAAVASQIDGRVGAAAWSYAAALGLALIYLGEHYLVDVLTGGALALAIRRLEPAARRPAAQLANALNDLCVDAWGDTGDLVRGRSRRRLAALRWAASTG
jgi:membrane-associated phospholipid phosphatase